MVKTESKKIGKIAWQHIAIYRIIVSFSSFCWLDWHKLSKFENSKVRAYNERERERVFINGK